MTTETWDPNATASSSADISMTDAAIKHFSKQLKKQTDAKGIRLWLKKSGCSGFKYELNFIDQIPEGEQSITINEDITLYVPNDAIEVLKGTVIDYATEGLNSSIKYINPKASNPCGCGESFSA